MKISLITLSLIFITVILTGCNSESIEVTAPIIRPVKLLEITDFNAGSTRVFPAKVAATKKAELAFRLSGHLVEFSLYEGDTVKKGAILARLDNRDARNTLLNREANYELVAADFKRKDELLRRKLISQSDYDLIKAKVKSAKASLSIAQDQLNYTELKAPYDGTVAKISIDNYQMVQANQPILVLQKNHSIDVVIQVPESLINNIIRFNPNVQAQPVVKFATKPDHVFPAILKEHATQVTPGTQSYEVVFTLLQPKDITILPGMSAELTIDISTSHSNKMIATLPASAITKRDSDGKSIIWIFNSDNGKVNSQIVSLGKVTAAGIEVIHGVNIGDKVVVAGVQYLTEDLTVKPLHWQRGV